MDNWNCSLVAGTTACFATMAAAIYLFDVTFSKWNWNGWEMRVRGEGGRSIEVLDICNGGDTYCSSLSFPVGNINFIWII